MTAPVKLIRLVEQSASPRNIEENFRRLERATNAMLSSAQLGHHEEQFTATSSYQVIHNLGAEPQVTVYDSAGVEISVVVTVIDENTLTLSFLGTLTDATVVVDVGILTLP